MKKKYKIENLDCGHCAAKLEEALGKIEGVRSAKVNFLTQKVTLDIEESNEERICNEVVKVVSKVIPNAKLL